jgi:hypothetical protein
MHVEGNTPSFDAADPKGPWFDHEDKLPNRPLYRIPEALALGHYTISRPIVEATIMICIQPEICNANIQ